MVDLSSFRSIKATYLLSSILFFSVCNVDIAFRLPPSHSLTNIIPSKFPLFSQIRGSVSSAHDYDIVVIGSGIGGLSAAAILSATYRLKLLCNCNGISVNT